MGLILAKFLNTLPEEDDHLEVKYNKRTGPIPQEGNL